MSLTSRDSLWMHLLRCLVFYANFYQFELESCHIPGSTNIAADAISRDTVALLLSLHPQVLQQTIPWVVLDLLVHTMPESGSQAWVHLFKATLIMELQSPPGQCIQGSGRSMSSSAPQEGVSITCNRILTDCLLLIYLSLYDGKEYGHILEWFDFSKSEQTPIQLLHPKFHTYL